MQEPINKEDLKYLQKILEAYETLINIRTKEPMSKEFQKLKLKLEANLP